MVFSYIVIGKKKMMLWTLVVDGSTPAEKVQNLKVYAISLERFIKGWKR